MATSLQVQATYTTRQIQEKVKRQKTEHEVFGCHSGAPEDSGLLGCAIVDVSVKHSAFLLKV
jgi:hypothetical protein